jgi:hypothetical protein
MTQEGQSDAGQYDRDSFVFGFDNNTTPFGGVTTGNHVATIVTFEPTGRYNIQRFAGLFTDTNIGAGFGDMDYDGVFTTTDIVGTDNNSVEDVLYSQNNKFRASFDVIGDGRGDNRDLFALGGALISGGASQPVLDAYDDLLRKRGDFNSSGSADGSDVAALYQHFGPATWLYDLNVDNVVDIDDIATMITELFRTLPGDFNLDGAVNSSDYVLARKFFGVTGALYTQGDADLDRDVDWDDLDEWQQNFGFLRQPLEPGGGGSSLVPEPSAPYLVASMAFVLVSTATQRTQRCRDRSNLPFEFCVQSQVLES